MQRVEKKRENYEKINDLYGEINILIDRIKSRGKKRENGRAK